MVAPVGHEAYNKNGEGGRPKKYTDEFIENEAIEFEKWMELPDSIYFKEFAFGRGYTSQLFSEWAQTNQRFSETFKKVREWQEFRVAKGTLKNEFNPSFAKFFMGNVCGWAEKIESKISGDAQNPLACIIEKISSKSKDEDGEEASE